MTKAMQILRGAISNNLLWLERQTPRLLFDESRHVRAWSSKVQDPYMHEGQPFELTTSVAPVPTGQCVR